MTDPMKIPCDRCGATGREPISGSEPFYINSGVDGYKLCDKCLGNKTVDFVENVVGTKWIHVSVIRESVDTKFYMTQPIGPAKGAIYYNEDIDEYFLFNGTEWEPIEQNINELEVCV